MMEKIGSCKTTIRCEDEHLKVAEQREKDFSNLKLELLVIAERITGLRATFREKVKDAVEQKVLLNEV